MTEQSFESLSAENTIAVGRRLAALMQPPLILILRGDLGAGKTTLVKGIAEALGAAEAEDVTSPTFTLVHEYDGHSLEGAEVKLYHLDLYRLEEERQLAALGLEEMMASNAILLIEWGEKFAGIIASADGEIAIAHRHSDRRMITFRLHG